MGFSTFVYLACLVFVPALATNHFAGIVVSNYVGNSGPILCRSQEQWNEAASAARDTGFGAIRILTFDCNALDLASSVAAAHDLKVMAGIAANDTTQINNDLQTFQAAYAQYGEDRYLGLTVGNEIDDSPLRIISRVDGARSYLRSVGVSTPVSTAHTWDFIRNNPVLCNADFVGANAFAFYDGTVTSGQTGDFVFKTVDPALKEACPGKKIYITESGWPSRGDSNGVAVASVNDESNALLNLNCADRDDPSVSVFAFEYDDQLWQRDENGRSFGIIGKIDLQTVFSPC